MKEYLRIFDNNGDYKSHISDLSIPSVSYTLQEKEVHYTPKDEVFNHYEYVDFGLPSGTVWAAKNVGAISNNDKGFFYSWGGVEGYNPDGPNTKNFDWVDYELGSGSSTAEGTVFLKYNSNDNLTQLELIDDAAHAYMGGRWEIPTTEQFLELVQTIPYEKTTINGTVGYLFDDGNGNTMFLPAVGHIHDTYTADNGNAHYWTKNLSSSDQSIGKALYSQGDMGEELNCITNTSRCYGLLVRGVIKL